jgi:hypothetical protein
MMEPVTTALRLMKRQEDLEHRRRRPGGISIIEERELFAIRDRLEEFPAAVAAIIEVASATRKSVDQIRLEDVERWDDRRAS